MDNCKKYLSPFVVAKLKEKVKLLVGAGFKMLTEKTDTFSYLWLEFEDEKVYVALAIEVSWVERRLSIGTRFSANAEYETHSVNLMEIRNVLIMYDEDWKPFYNKLNKCVADVLVGMANAG